MKKLHYGHCLVGVAVAAVALIALGVSASTLGFLAVVLACPLMMFVMMRMMMGDASHGGSHGCSHDGSHDGSHDDPVEHDHHR